ncbi:TPA: MaoC family dehydratase N-terminal domain-containing protein [Pseudomonas aeruginosa]|nr:MaoC family dehydratase N-terminal domain-containing protein [Pseudomonas aeruginosa]HEJ3161377.1 MaoC family dehydratase N-terminal domain-containing protein [Pseudomonas aeruginosa]
MNKTPPVPGAVLAQMDSPVLDHARLQDYANASGDLNPLHLQTDFARQAGFDDVIAHGMLGMAQLGCLLNSRFGQERILAFSTRFVAVVPVGSMLRCTARLEAIEDEQAILSLDAVLVTTGQVAISGSARITWPNED